MEFQKISSPSLKELFVEQLEDMILSGKLKIGERLPPERQLAEQMQVSRAVVNGGLSQLEKCGFITVKPRSGTFVADYRKNGNIDTLVAIMKYRGGKIRNEEIRSILEVRLALDTLITKQTIETATSETIEKLSHQVEIMKDGKSISETVEAAYAFQHEIALASNNTLVPLIFQSFRSTIIAMWERFCTIYGTEVLYSNNKKLLEYIKNRDTDGALKWLEHSINECLDGSMQIYYEN